MKQLTIADISESVVDGPFGSNLKRSDYVDSGVPVLQGKNITGDTFVWKDVRYISKEKAESLKRSSVILGDHLLVKIGSIGYSAILDDLNNHSFAIIPANLARIRPNKKVINSRYLHNWLKSDFLKRHLNQVASKTAQPALNLTKIKNAPIPLPPLAEQKRIAAILDQADALRQHRQRALDHLNQLGQSIFYEMFGDPISNTNNFDQLPLAELVRIRRGGSPRPIKKFIGGTIPWIKIGDATKGDELYLWKTKVKIHESGLNKTVLVEPDSLIFANCGVSLGFARVTKIQGAIHDGWLVFDQFSSKLNQLFLLSLINFITPKLRDMAPDGTQPNLNTKIMGGLPIILPPVQSQEKFVKTILHLRAQNDLLAQELENTNSLFASLQQRAFRGEL